MRRILNRLISATRHDIARHDWGNSAVGNSIWGPPHDDIAVRDDAHWMALFTHWQRTDIELSHQGSRRPFPTYRALSS